MKYRFIKIYIDLLNWFDQFEWFFTNGRKSELKNRKISFVTVLYADGSKKQFKLDQWKLFSEGIEKLQTKRIQKYYL